MIKTVLGVFYKLNLFKKNNYEEIKEILILLNSNPDASDIFYLCMEQLGNTNHDHYLFDLSFFKQLFSISGVKSDDVKGFLRFILKLGKEEVISQEVFLGFNNLLAVISNSDYDNKSNLISLIPMLFQGKEVVLNDLYLLTSFFYNLLLQEDYYIDNAVDFIKDYILKIEAVGFDFKLLNQWLNRNLPFQIDIFNEYLNSLEPSLYIKHLREEFKDSSLSRIKDDEFDNIKKLYLIYSDLIEKGICHTKFSDFTSKIREFASFENDKLDKLSTLYGLNRIPFSFFLASMPDKFLQIILGDSIQDVINNQESNINIRIGRVLYELFTNNDFINQRGLFNFLNQEIVIEDLTVDLFAFLMSDKFLREFFVHEDKEIFDIISDLKGSDGIFLILEAYLTSLNDLDYNSIRERIQVILSLLQLIKNTPLEYNRLLNYSYFELKSQFDSLQKIKRNFIFCNSRLEKNRRVNEEQFFQEYLPLCYSMELVVPGMLEQIGGLVNPFPGLKKIKKQFNWKNVEQVLPGFDEELSKFLETAPDLEEIIEFINLRVNKLLKMLNENSFSDLNIIINDVLQSLHKCLDLFSSIPNPNVLVRFLDAKRGLLSDYGGLGFLAQVVINAKLEMLLKKLKKYDQARFLSLDNRKKTHSLTVAFQDFKRRLLKDNQNDSLFVRETLKEENLSYYIKVIYIAGLNNIISIDEMIKIINKSADLQEVINRINSLKKELSNYETASKEFRALLNKVSLPLSELHKIINTSSILIDKQDIQYLRNILNDFSSEKSYINELHYYLTIKYLKPLAKTLDISEKYLNPRVMSKLYLPYVSKLRSAYLNIAKNYPQMLDWFKGTLIAMFKDDFWDFIENENQGNFLGKKLAYHNKKIREILTKMGIASDKWLGRDLNKRLKHDNFIYYERSLFKYDPVYDVEKLIRYLKLMIELPISNNLKEKIINVFNTVGLETGHSDDLQVDSVIVNKKGKMKKDIVTILTDETNLNVLLKLVVELIKENQIFNVNRSRKLMEYAKEEIVKIKNRLSLKNYKKELIKMRKSFILRPMYRDPGHDLFIGDFTGCCIGMDSVYPQAMIQRLIDEGCNVIECVDEYTGKTIACLWLYLSEKGNVVIQNIEILKEYGNSVSMKNKIGAEMINYAKKLVTHINAEKLIIGMPFAGDFFGENSFVEKHYKNKRIRFGGGKVGGYFEGESYFLDTALKPEAYLAFENQRRNINKVEHPLAESNKIFIKKQRRYLRLKSSNTIKRKTEIQKSS